MKKIIIVALLVVASALGFLYWQQSRQAADKQAEAAAAKQRLAEAEVEAERQEQRSEAEQARLSAINAQLAEKAAKAARLEQARLTNTPASPATGAKTEHPMAAVLKDADMKEVMRKQARESVARSVKQLVSTNLIQELGLNEEQTATLKQLLTRKGTLGFDFLMPVMTGELDEASLAELGRKTRAAMAALTEDLRSFLGEESYRTFEAYEKTQPDRERVDKFVSRQAEAGQPLTPEQQRQLLAAMSEERSNFRFAIDYSDSSQIDYEHFHDFYAKDKMENYFREMEQLIERISQRAQSVLPADQAAEFNDLLKAQLHQSKFVVKTTNAMLDKHATR
jgi:hypothetical protein